MSHEEPVAIEFELTPEDWVDTCAVHSLESPMTKKAFRQVRWLFVAICVVLALLQVLTGWSGGALVWLLGAAFGYTVLPSVLRHSQRHQLAKMSRMGIANGMFGPHRVELRDEGVLDCTTGYEWLTRWSSIERIEEANGTFMIYSGPNAFLPIPASAFRDAKILRSFGDRFFACLNDARAREQDELARAIAGPRSRPLTASLGARSD